MTPHQIHSYTLAYLDGRIGDANLQLLDRELQHSPEARRQYWLTVEFYEAMEKYFRQEVGLHAASEARFEQGLAEMLRHEQEVEVSPRRLDDEELASVCGRDDSLEPQRRADEPTSLALQSRRTQKLLEIAGIQVVRRPNAQSGRFTLKRVQRLAWAAMLLLVLVLSAMLMREPAPQTASTSEIAHLVDAVAAHWRDGEGSVASLDVGVAVEPGHLELVAGFAEFEMANGTRVLLEGPVTFELQQHNLMRVERGRLVARMGEQSRSFTVVTPTASITDLGTEIGVDVNKDGRTHASVFDGAARFIALAVPNGEAMIPVRVDAGYAASAEQGGQAVVQAMDELIDSPRFVRDIPEVYQQLVMNSNPLVYLDFDQVNQQSVMGPSGLSARILGSPRQVELPFGHGMTFSGDGDYLDIPNVARRLRGSASYSIEAYVQVHSGSGGVVAAVPGPHGNAATTSMLLEFRPDADQRMPDHAQRIRFLHRENYDEVPDEYVGTNLFSDQPYGLDDWYHVVAVKHPDQVQLYINGKLAASHTDDSLLSRTSQTLRLGRHEDKLSYRYLHGTVSDFAVYRQALSPQDIEQRFLALQVRNMKHKLP